QEEQWLRISRLSREQTLRSPNTMGPSLSAIGGGLDKAPMLVGVHGGGWQIGDRKFYTHWGSYLAKNGYAVFAVEYRLMKPGFKTHPGAVYDVKAAVQYVRARAGELGLDPNRIALMGDSSGAHLSALVALAGEEPAYSTEYRNDPNSSISHTIKAV